MVISGFSMDDLISVTGAAQGDFSATNPNAQDLILTFNDGTNFSRIYLDDVFDTDPGFIFDVQDAIDALGFNFINFA